MSDNSQVEIFQEGGRFFLRHIDVDTGTGHKTRHTYDTLTAAIDGADDYCTANLVEYGYRVDESARREK